MYHHINSFFNIGTLNIYIKTSVGAHPRCIINIMRGERNCVLLHMDTYGSLNRKKKRISFWNLNKKSIFIWTRFHISFTWFHTICMIMMPRRVLKKERVFFMFANYKKKSQMHVQRRVETVTALKRIKNMIIKEKA